MRVQRGLRSQIIQNPVSGGRLRKYGFRDWDSVLAAIGHGGLKEGQVFNKLVEAYDKEIRRI